MCPYPVTPLKTLKDTNVLNTKHIKHKPHLETAAQNVNGSQRGTMDVKPMVFKSWCSILVVNLVSIDLEL